MNQQNFGFDFLSQLVRKSDDLDFFIQMVGSMQKRHERESHRIALDDIVLLMSKHLKENQELPPLYEYEL